MAMSNGSAGIRPLQKGPLAGGIVVAGAVLLHVLLSGPDSRNATLFLIAIGLGVALYQGALGFAGAYRRFFLERETSGLIAQVWMLALATLLFAPVLANGTAFGETVTGAVAPVGISMFLGAFLFGIGMQIGGGCGSGTLFTVGGGDLRMVVTLVFFCLGGFWGSLDLAWWREFPEMPGFSLGQALGYGRAALLQLLVLAIVCFVLYRARKPSPSPATPKSGRTALDALRGPWPLLLSAGILAVLNWATLVVAGHPWAITWGLTLWGAKAVRFVGWDPATSPFWTGAFQANALSEPALRDPTSVMDIGIVIGAFLAASFAGRIAPSLRIPPRALLASVFGGLMLGYGARLAYGCNIGAFFSGVASTSLHGWVWIVAALPGNWVGVKLRPYFHLSR